MRIFNTLGRRIEELTVNNKSVSIYVCGITPYDTTHLGHARTYVFFDTFRRYLEYLGNKVSYVQNITDIDDPLFERARELGVPYQSLVDKYVDIFFNDARTLNMMPADAYPRVSQEMDKIVRVVDGLVTTGHAYAKEGRVYFRVSSFPEYGDLSVLDCDSMLALEEDTGEDIHDPRKENPLDFLLWKPSAPDEPSWPSPYGQGRPGWHIECSTMSLDLLGSPIDIHGGGEDLIFPHHENEIALSESFTGKKPFVRYWLHVAMVHLNGVKMSKSLGNMIFVSDLLKRYAPNAIRLYLLQTHYRKIFDYSEKGLQEAKTLDNLLLTATSLDLSGPSSPERINSRLAGFRVALDNDFDMPSAISFLKELATDVLAAPEVEKQEGVSALREAMRILGLRTTTH